jgi:undecaprenyl-diphosphatase
VWAVAIVAVWTGVGRLLAHVEAHDALGRADLAVVRWLADHRTAWLNAVTGVLSAMASTKVVVAIGFLLALAAGLTWRRWREPAMLLITLLGEVAIFLSITALVDRPRPPVVRLDVAPPTSSFPSGHTAASVALYGALAVLASERFHGRSVHWLALVLTFVVPAAVAFSRMYRGMHYPTDVLAGAAMASLWLVVSLHSVRMGAWGSAPATPSGGRRA